MIRKQLFLFLGLALLTAPMNLWAQDTAPTVPAVAAQAGVAVPQDFTKPAPDTQTNEQAPAAEQAQAAEPAPGAGQNPSRVKPVDDFGGRENFRGSSFQPSFNVESSASNGPTYDSFMAAPGMRGQITYVEETRINPDGTTEKVKRPVNHSPQPGGKVFQGVPYETINGAGGMMATRNSSREPNKTDSATAQLKAATSPEETQQALDLLNAALVEDYDQRLDTYQKYIDELESKLNDMKSKLERRREAREDMVKLRLQVIQAEVNDLGWPAGMNSRDSNTSFLGPGPALGNGSPFGNASPSATQQGIRDFLRLGNGSPFGNASPLDPPRRVGGYYNQNSPFPSSGADPPSTRYQNPNVNKPDVSNRNFDPPVRN